MKNYFIMQQRHSLYLERDIQIKKGVSLFLYPYTDKTLSQGTVSVGKFFHASTESGWCQLSPFIYEGQKVFFRKVRTKYPIFVALNKCRGKKMRNFHSSTENALLGRPFRY